MKFFVRPIAVCEDSMGFFFHSFIFHFSLFTFHFDNDDI